MTRASELSSLADEELARRADEAAQELFNLRFQLVTGQLDNVSRIGQLRREIARVRTIQRARALEDAGALRGRPSRRTEEASR